MQAANDPDTVSSADPSTSIQNGTTTITTPARRERPARACTARSAARLHAAAAAEAEEAAFVRRKAGRKRERREREEREEEREPTPPPEPQCKIVTKLVGEPLEGQETRWRLRSMWELASVLNFLNVFRPLLNVKVEFSVEELETALITPNSTLANLHIPLLKAIPPIARMALGHNTWITVLCRKLRDWWYWVAEGELPIVASHGTEFEAYIALDPAVRVIILKAICDIRVEQEDIRNHIDDSIKRGIHLSTFRKERAGGDSYGISYWYEDDPIIGHRLYREIRKVDAKKAKGKNSQPLPSSCYQWETVATNLDDFLDVSEKLFTSKNRTEASLGKKLKTDMIPEIEIVNKRKEKLLKKQHREALLLDNAVHMDGFGPGRSLRDRKHVTYTFDDYDKSISEAIKTNKNRPPSPDSIIGKENDASTNDYTNAPVKGPRQNPQEPSFDAPSPMSSDYDEHDEDSKDELVDRSNRRRQRSQRYSTKEYIDEISEGDDDNDNNNDNGNADSDYEDDIVGEAVYDEEYLSQKKKKRKKMSSGSEGDEEFNWDDENLDEEEEEEDDNSSNTSEDSDAPRKTRKLRNRPGRRTKSRSVSELQSGLRRSRRATKSRINYKKYEMSDSEDENANMSFNDQTDTEHEDYSEESPEEEKENEGREVAEQHIEEIPETIEEKVVQNNPPEVSNSSGQDEIEGGRTRRFLDLNELAPGSGFDDGPDTDMKDEDTDDF